MRRLTACLVFSTLVASIVATPPLAAQTSKDKHSGLDRLEGTIVSLNKEERSMRVRQRNRRDMVWTVLYDDETAVTYQNEDTTEEDLKVDRRVIVLGRFVEGTIRLQALRIEVRSGR